VPTELPQTAVEHLYPFLILLGVFVAVLGGIVLGLINGWNAVIAKFKEMLDAHTVTEEKWQNEISQRLRVVERNVRVIRDNLIKADLIEVEDTMPSDDLDTKP
jgi:hypothetical protein